MKFKVVDSLPEVRQAGELYLVTDNWNDWFKYKTLYDLYYIDDDNDKQYIGAVKIGQFDKVFDDYTRPDVPLEFEELSDAYFSLGQDESYYDNLRIYEKLNSVEILSNLRDCAYNLELFDRALDTPVMINSLLRSVTKYSVRGQFNRIAKGGDKLEPYSFNFILADLKRNKDLNLLFDIFPDSKPPTNVHVIIGRNGVGKTRLLNGMINALLNIENEKYKGIFTVNDGLEESLFSKLVAVTFSAFDQTYPIEEPDDYEGELEYSYIGLKKYEQQNEAEYSEDSTNSQMVNKSNKDLFTDFKKSFEEDIKVNKVKMELWKRSINEMDSDPLFKEIGLIELITDRRADLEKIFDRLSSGHKIVVLSITRLVASVEEKTIVLLDEPEAHLHPPLLSAFIRSISDLLIHRNGIALIATHSPVVLQEIPKSCVWKLSRSGVDSKVERLNRETFGENIGILSREVFGYEVTNSGFHDLIKTEVDKGMSFEEIVNEFKNELGNEALSIVRGLCYRRDN